MTSASRKSVPIKSLMEITLFVSLFCGTVLLYPAWYHHNLIEESPVMATQALAGQWVKNFEQHAGATCLPSSIDFKVHQLPAGEGWFADFKCNTPSIYARLVAIFLVPGLVAFALMAMVMIWPEKHKKPL